MLAVLNIFFYYYIVLYTFHGADYNRSHRRRGRHCKLCTLSAQL